MTYQEAQKLIKALKQAGYTDVYTEELTSNDDKCFGYRVYAYKEENGHITDEKRFYNAERR